MKKVLVVADYYLPAKKGGGAARSLENQVEAIGREIDFYIITRDRDLGDSSPYPGISKNVWVRVGQANVCYTLSGLGTMLAFWRALRQINPDFVCLGSVVAVWYSMVPILILRLSGWIGATSRQLIIGPHGQFGVGALRVKAIRKRAFLGLSRLIGFHSGIIWHASSTREAEQIKRWMGTRVPIRIAVNIWKPRIVLQSQLEKYSGSASIIYISRISPEKNLLGAIRLLTRVSGHVEFRIFGPIASSNYWDDCQRELEKLPGNTMYTYGGTLDANGVFSEFGRAHLFLFPTPGESFGHIILDALSVGCPVLCSDLTPWGEISEFGAGWVERLSEPQQFIRRIEQTIDMDAAQWLDMSRKAKRFAELYGQRNDAVQANRELFKA